MFLKALGNEEKKSFLDLALRIAKSDEDFSVKEKGMIEEYKYEMNLDYDPESTYLEKEQIDLIEVFSDSEPATIKKIFIELIALIMADEKFAESEKDIIKEFMERYNLSDDYLKNVQDWVKKLNGLYQEGVQLIEG